MSPDNPEQFLKFFPVFFVGMWFVITTMLGLLSGWFGLQSIYDEPSDEPLLILRGQSGSMGIGVSLGGILKLGAYPSGLGIGIWRLFGPFQRTFLVPWNEIEAVPSRSFFTPMTRLRLGRSALGSLKISARSWSKLVEAAKPAVVSPKLLPSAPPISTVSIARGMLFEWLAITIVASAFFYFGTRAAGAAAGVPAEVCILFPAIAFGFGQLIRYARLR